MKLRRTMMFDQFRNVGGVIALSFVLGLSPPCLGAPGEIYSLGTTGGRFSISKAINATGQVAGSTENLSWPDHERAFRYDGVPASGGVMHELGYLGGTFNSYSTGINDAGQVTGFASIADTEAYHAFRYDGTPGSGGVMRDLGDLGALESFAYGINATGHAPPIKPPIRTIAPESMGVSVMGWDFVPNQGKDQNVLVFAFQLDHGRSDVGLDPAVNNDEGAGGSDWTGTFWVVPLMTVAHPMPANINSGTSKRRMAMFL